MTKKNAKKIIARARTEKLGGKYQHHLRQLGGAGGVDSPEAHSTEAQKYVHVVDGTPDGTSWLLSDEPHGALLSIAVPSGPLTTQLAEEAFAQAAFPLTCETSMDLGKTWVQHSDGPQREWNAAIRLLYGRLGLGTGPWNAARIRTRTGTELVRHPPKLLSENLRTTQTKHGKCGHHASGTQRPNIRKLRQSHILDSNHDEYVRDLAGVCDTYPTDTRNWWILGVLEH